MIQKNSGDMQRPLSNGYPVAVVEKLPSAVSDVEQDGGGARWGYRTREGTEGGKGLGAGGRTELLLGSPLNQSHFSGTSTSSS
jgi:hypothetical protein